MLTNLPLCVMGRPKSTKKGKNKENKSPESYNRPAKFRSWSNEPILKAMEAVKNGMGVKRAVLEHDIPRTTLKNGMGVNRAALALSRIEYLEE